MAGKKLKKTETGCRPGQLFGLWYMDGERLTQYRDQVERIDLVALAKSNDEQSEEGEGEISQDVEQNAPAIGTKPYPLTKGVAVITISGPTTKYKTSFQSMIGGTSTLAVIRQLRQATSDPDVRGIMVHLEDCPGGTVAGAYETRDEIRAAAKIKPMRGHISECAVSAGFLFGSSAGGYLSANETAFLGSIGTRTVLTDRSKQFENQGVKTITVDSGKYKSLGVPGTVITDEQIAEVQSHIDGLNEIFITSIAENRKISADMIRAMEARIYLAPKAVELKLADKVCSFEQAFTEFVASLDAAEKTEPDLQRTQRGSTDMTLLEQCRAMFGNPTMSETEATTRLTAMQTDLTNARASIPKTMDAEVCSALFGVAIDRIDLAVERGKLAAPAAAAIKLQCGWVADGTKDATGAAMVSKPNPFMLAKRPELGGKSVVDFTLSAFDGVEFKGPKAGEKTDKSATELHRQAPSNESESEEIKQQQEGGDSAVAKFKKQRGLTETAAAK